MPRLPLLAVSLALPAALLLVPPSLGASRFGSDSSETLIGTTKADRITGAGGDDTLKGLAGNDTYYFADGWGSDTLEDLATYKVGGKTRSGGIDTLSFRGLTDSGVIAKLIHQWGPSSNIVTRIAGGEQIALGDSFIERLVGSRNYDALEGGGEVNLLDSGGGDLDDFVDFGGWKEGAHGLPGLPASSDVYRGVAANTGTVYVQDWGGTGDVLDLRPLASDQVYLAAVDCGDGDPERECLQIVTGNGDGQVLVYGQFGEVASGTTETGQQGRIEVLRFADGDVRLDDDVTVSATALRTGSPSGKALSPRQQKEAQRARTLLAEAVRESAGLAEPGVRPAASGVHVKLAVAGGDLAAKTHHHKIGKHSQRKVDKLGNKPKEARTRHAGVPM